jgi:hypothetical protein
MKYPACENESCLHNDTYLCKAEVLDEDIICKQGKADALITSSIFDDKRSNIRI